MKITEKIIDKITSDIYGLYSSGSGVLFGISYELRGSVRAIVKLSLEADLEVASKATEE